MAAVGLIVAGCSGEPTEAASGNGTDPEKSPLTEYLGYSPFTTSSRMSFSGGGADPVEPTEEERENFRRVQELTAECMRDEGFEYVPQTMDNVKAGYFDEAFSLELEQFVKRYGYGFSLTAFGGDEDEYQDPNEEIRQSLSGSAREAYERALWGAVDGFEISIDAEADPEDVVIDPEDMGCTGIASAQVYGESGVPTLEVNPGEPGGDELFRDVEALGDRFRRDPRIVAATEEWAECMAGNGYPDFKEPQQAENAVFDRILALQGLGGEGDESANSAGGFAVMAGPDADVDPDDVEELQQYEIDVATADYDCQRGHYQETHDEVAREMEQQFVDDHREELERFRDQMAEMAGHG